MFVFSRDVGNFMAVWSILIDMRSGTGCWGIMAI